MQDRTVKGEMSKKRRNTARQNDGEKLLRYGVTVFLSNKEVDAITVENRSGSISLRRREIPQSYTHAIGFTANFDEDDNDYYEEDKKAHAKRFK